MNSPRFTAPSAVPTSARYISYPDGSVSLWGVVGSRGLLLASMALCLFDILLPVDFGGLRVTVSGLSVRTPFVISLCAFLWTVVFFPKSSARAVHSLTFGIHSLFVILATLSTIFVSVDRSVGIPLIAYGTAIYCFNYVTLFVLYNTRLRDSFQAILLCALGASAVLGIVESLLRKPLPIYASLISHLDLDLESLGSSDQYRVFGTAGNALLYAGLMMMAVPLVAETSFRSRFVRFGLTGAVITASLVTLSKTSVVMFLPYVLGYLVIHRKRISYPLLAVAIITPIAGWAAFGPALADVPFVQRWLTRMGSGSDYGVEYRQGLISTALNWQRDTLSMMIGDGPGSIYLVSEAVRAGSGSNDNTLVVVFMDFGVLGVLCYCAYFTWILFRYRQFALSSLHWYGILSACGLALSINTLDRFSSNFLLLCSLLTLEERRRFALQNSK